MQALFNGLKDLAAAQRSDLWQKNKALKKNLEAKEREVQTLGLDTARNNRHVEELQADLLEKEQEILKLSTTVEKKDENIQHLEARVNKAEAATRQIQEAHAKAEKAHDLAVAENNTSMNELQDMLREKKNEIRSINTKAAEESKGHADAVEQTSRLIEAL